MKIKEGSGMDIQEEREAYLGELLEREVITQDEFRDLVFKPEVNAFDSNYLSSRFIDKINFGWSVWQAKAQAVPEGFVLASKEPSADLINHGHQVFLGHFNEGGQTGGRSLYFAYKAMIEAQEQSHE